MARRKRRAPQEGDFQDPLKNYDGPQRVDGLERSLIEAKVGDMKIQPFATVTPQTSVQRTLEEMAKLNIACVLVVEDDRLLGIFSERDVLMKVADQLEQLKDRPVSEVMTPKPVYVHRTDSPAKAVNLMAVSGFRHVPIVNVDDKVVGVLGPRRVTAYLRNHFKN